MWGFGPEGYGSGWMWSAGSLVMMLFFLLIVAAILVGAIAFARREWRGGQYDGRARSSGLAILEERYAKGDIQREEYLAKKHDLGAT